MITCEKGLKESSDALENGGKSELGRFLGRNCPVALKRKIWWWGGEEGNEHNFIRDLSVEREIAKGGPSKKKDRISDAESAGRGRSRMRKSGAAVFTSRRGKGRLLAQGLGGEKMENKDSGLV